MNVLGVELEYDFFDADLLDKYERANQKVATDIKEPTQYQNKSTADSIRIQCRILDSFFDEVFGTGTAQKIFRGKVNIRDHMEAFGIVTHGAIDARAEFDAIEEKYTPNRAERRQVERDNRQNQKQFSRNYYNHAAGKNKGKNHKH